MLFTWDTDNLCIVFSQWRVTGTFSLVISILAVMALTAGYEAIRETSRNYEARQAERIESAPRKSKPPFPFFLIPSRKMTLPCFLDPRLLREREWQEWTEISQSIPHPLAKRNTKAHA